MIKDQLKDPKGVEQRLKYATKVALVFLSAFLAMTIFEVHNYHQTSPRISQNMTSLSNAHSNISPYDLDHYKGRKLILYSSTCKACHERIPKYYSLNHLVDSFTFHKDPIYLDINQKDNRDIFNALSIPSTPKQAKIISAQYDNRNHLPNDIQSSQNDVVPSRSIWQLFFINIFWSAVLALLYISLCDGARYWYDKLHRANHE